MSLFGAALLAALVARQLGPREVLREVEEPTGDDLIDRDTGLGNARQLREALAREIARCVRYGDRNFLAVAEVWTFGFHPLQEGELPPSHGKFAASVLLRQLRDSDTVHRLDENHFALVLPECDAEGATLLASRLRTALASEPFARNDDGSAIYLRAWLGGVSWNPSLKTPDDYIDAAATELNASRGTYEAAQKWFRGELTPPRPAGQQA
jgi:PleD family two-component response regulator